MIGDAQHPDSIGKYAIEEYLGGGMSHVYRAKDPRLDKTVVIKLLTAHASADEESRQRFLREARLAAKMDHPNILTVYDFVENQSQPYMVMEFLRGDDLRKVIKENRTGDLENKLRIALQIARALEYIHAQNIIHRDIKPENVHLSASGNVKLMDFGIAKTEDLTITRPGFTMGTPYYMAPEQILGKEVTHLADVYAFGILLFELFTGDKPISGEQVEQIFFRILQEPLNLQPLKLAGTPQSITALVDACTAKDPQARPQSFSEVCRTLSKALDESDASSRPIAQPAPKPTLQRWVWAGAAGVLILVAFAGVYWSTRPSTPPPPPVVTTAPTPKPTLAAVLQTPSGEMVLVSEGEFLSGANNQRETLPAFYIDRTEVTNEAYGKFCKETGKTPPPDFAKAPLDSPVVDITIDDARQFARWAGKRLPKAKEWEKAARGTDGRNYPWGNEASRSLANVHQAQSALTSLFPDNFRRPASVMDFPDGDSPWGVRQMVGNVWELVDELSLPSAQAVENFKSLLQPAPGADEPWYRIMGGSYRVALTKGLTYDSAFVPARFRSSDIGFRCVKDAG